MKNPLISDRSGYAVWVFALIGAVHFLYASVSVLPTIYPDEIGYLMNAAALAGYHSDVATRYFAGYSLLIAPAYLLGGSGESVYFYVKIINTGLFLGAFVALYHLVRKLLPSVLNSDALMAIAVVSFYPAFLIFNALAISESAFVLLFVLAAFSTLYLKDTSPLGWIALGLCVGLLLMVHPKSAPVALSAILITGVLAVTNKRFFDLAIFLAVVGLCFLAALKLNVFVKEALTFNSVASDSSYPTVATLAGRVFSWNGLVTTLGNLAGQSLYLITATIGTMVFGVVVAFRKLGEGYIEHRHTWAFLLLSLAGTALISTMSLDSSATGSRLDHVFYGRYNEGVLAPLMVIGLLSVPRKIKPWAVLTFAVAILAYLTHLYLVSYPKPSTGLLNMSSLYYMRYFEPRMGIFHPGVIFGVFASIVVIWLLISRVSSVRILPIVFGVFMFTASAYAVDLLYIYSHARQMQTQRISTYISENLEPGHCVNYDMDSSGWRKMWLYPFVLYRYPIKRVSASQEAEFCSDWLISDRADIPQRFPGAIPVAEEKYGEEVLWRLSSIHGGAAAPH